MSNLFLVAALSLPTVGFLSDTDHPNAPKLQWSRHYDKAKDAARTAKRPLLVVIEKPSVDGEKLDEEQLTTDEAQKKLLDKFHLCRVDATTDYGKRVAEAFGAQRFPYTAIIDKKSRSVVFRKAGQMSQKEWRRALVQRSARSSAKVTVRKPIVTDFGTSIYGSSFSQALVPASGTCFT